MMDSNFNNGANISYYDDNAESFYNNTVDSDMSEWRSAFLKYIPKGGYVLDAGCGSGRDSKAFLMGGYNVLSFDASARMCDLASRLTGQTVYQYRFEDIDFINMFDGVWACASLLHVSPEGLPFVLKRMHKAMKSCGVMYASFKYGNGITARGERIFSDFNETSINPILSNNGFSIEECAISFDGRRERRAERWLNVIAKKIV